MTNVGHTMIGAALNLSRRIAAAGASALLLAGAAFADARAEDYVEKNATKVLQALNSPELSAAERTDAFNAYMNQFADIPLVARRVLGRYARTLPQEDIDAFSEAFNDFALAVYENELDQYRGDAINVTGSIDIRERDSIVKSKLENSTTGEVLKVEWHVRQDKNNPEVYKVLDVGLNIDGSLIWLAQQQGEQFKSILDRSNGDVDALIERINGMTENLRKADAEGENTRFGELDVDATDG